MQAPIVSPKAAMKRTRLLAALAAVSILGACASAPPSDPPRPPPGLFQDGAFTAPSHRVDAADVFALSPAMKRYLEVDIAPQLRTMGRQQGLIDALHSRAHLRLDYDTDSTRTAAEAFDARAGNCLSLVVMTAALAKQLELPIQYQALVGQETWSRSGDLSFVNGHVNITVAQRLIDRLGAFDANAQLRLDFGAVPVGRGAALQAVSESTIVAMFMNNRAAEALVRGGVDEAYAYAREAVVQDPTLRSGVQHAGRGLPAPRPRRGAEARVSAMRWPRRQAPWLRCSTWPVCSTSQGRSAEAAPWRAKLARLEAEPPFHYFDLGRAAAQAGDFLAARDYILREMRRDPDYHEFHFWLAVALYGLGEVEQAREHMTTAMNNSTTRREHAIYASKLQRLNTAATHAN